MVHLDFDKPRLLCYDLAAIRDLENALNGQPLGVIVGQLANLGINALVISLWAGLKHEDRTITPHLVTKRLETYLKDGKPLRALADAINDGLEESGLFKVDGTRRETGSRHVRRWRAWTFRRWLTWAEAFSLGELQLLPAQFWHLTPHEFRVLRDGFHRREDRAWEKIATLGLWILAPHTKQKLTVGKLLGRATLQTLPRLAGADEPSEAQVEAERARVLAQALAWADDPDG